MAIRRVLRADQDVLRRRAAAVKKLNRAVGNLLGDMAETMYAYRGVGLAAPQIGISRRLIVLDPGEGPLLKLINPRLLEMEGEESAVEGCLSIPGVYGEVPRAARVVVEALDPGGSPLRLEETGFLARILQHEIDHLDGILFVDRAVRLLEPEETAEGEQI